MLFIRVIFRWKNVYILKKKKLTHDRRGRDIVVGEIVNNNYEVCLNDVTGYCGKDVTTGLM